MVSWRSSLQAWPVMSNSAHIFIELDINPLMLLAKGQGVVAADALVSLNAKPMF